MWEYRVAWTTKPSWWDRAWEHGVGLLAGDGREPEPRPDTYLVLSDRIDVGIKLRGKGDNGFFDIKVRYQQDEGWELWEKNVIVSWNSLERTRVAALMRLGPALGGADKSHINAATPWAGVKAGLADLGLEGPEVEVGKKRIQAAAGALLKAVPGFSGSHDWLAELAEFTLPSRRDPVWSICLECVAPVTRSTPLPADGGRLCGYPELLARHAAGTL